jgi:hypothetical protein
MDFTNILIEELIAMRAGSRVAKDWKSSDEIRNHLDTKLVFVFDTKDGQEVHYLTQDFFKFQVRIENSIPVKSFSEWLNDTTRVTMTKRQFVEHQIKSEINAEKNFDAWLYTALRGVTKR